MEKEWRSLSKRTNPTTLHDRYAWDYQAFAYISMLKIYYKIRKILSLQSRLHWH